DRISRRSPHSVSRAASSAERAPSAPPIVCAATHSVTNGLLAPPPNSGLLVIDRAGFAYDHVGPRLTAIFISAQYAGRSTRVQQRAVPVTQPFHSVEETNRTKVYHDNGLGELRAAIPSASLALGKDNRPICPRCRLLDQLAK